MIILILPDVSVDSDRLLRARAGDKEAITEIYTSYFDPVYQFVRLRVGNPQIAEDLTGDIFVRFVQTLKTDKAPHTSLRGWIFRVARHRITDHYREEPALPPETLDEWIMADTDTNPEVEALRMIEARRTRQAIAMLAPAQQEVLLLRFDQQLSLQETADVMGKNANAIKALQFRALNTLREILRQHEAEA
jgi:RNA polymerase sigma-70 factor (ECF subfamily)